MLRMEGTPQEVASIFLCLEVCSYIQDFNIIYSQMRSTPPEGWPSLVEGNFGRLFSRHHEFVRLGEVMCSSNNTIQNHNNISAAINAGTVASIKAERNCAFEDMRRRSHVSLSNVPNGPYPITTLKEEDLIELSCLIPGEDGWMLVYSSEQIHFFLSTEQFGIVLEVPDAANVNYGIYKASRVPGQSMSGLEFSQLSESTQCRIARAISGSNQGDPAFDNTMDGLFRSVIVLSCIFMQCLEKPTDVQEDSDDESYGTHASTEISLTVGGFPPVRPPWGVIGDRQLVRPRSLENISTRFSTPRAPTSFQVQPDRMALESPCPLRPITNGQAIWPLINQGPVPSNIGTKIKNGPGGFSRLIYETGHRNEDEENRPYSAPATDPAHWNGCRLRRIMTAAAPLSEVDRSVLGWTQSENGHSRHWCM